ncbi:MAG: hypothetical protein LBN36_03175 [Clostridiales Family XIII bacterium]|jgi:hypothetical protein|nr:hypothetical protein [Clostridiales Family XIII bacterium]
MKCTLCGESNPAGARFCQNCGGDLTADSGSPETFGVNPANSGSAYGSTNPAYAAPGSVGAGATGGFAVHQPPQKRGPGKKILLFGGIGVVVIIAIILVFVFVVNGSGSGSYAYPEHNFSILYNEEDDETLVIMDGKLLSGKIDGNYNYTQGDLKNTLRVLLDYENTLWLIKDNKVSELVDDVYSYEVSQDGTYVIYIDDDDTLYQLTVSSAKKTKIADDVSTFSVSPDGNTIAYAEYDDGEYELFVSVSGKNSKVGNDLRPVAVSDSGKYLYCVNGDGKLYVTSAGKDEKTKLSSEFAYLCAVNNDHTQIIFTDGDKTYFVEKDGEKQKIGSSSNLSRISPIWASSASGSLLNTVYVDSDGKISIIDKKLESTKLASDASSIKMTKDGKTIFYLKSDNLYRIKVGKNAEAEKLANDVYSYDITADGSYVYFINDDEELMFIKGSGEEKRIADDVRSLSVSHDDLLFYLNDYSDRSGTGTLYVSSNGKAGEKVADDVYRFYTYYNYTSYYVEGGDDYLADIYTATSGKSFTKAATDITYYY